MRDTSHRTILLKNTYGSNAVARVARGYSMGAIQDGWLIFYDELNRAPRAEVIGKLCVAKLEDGRTLLRFIHKGRRADCYDLLAVSGPAILDVRLEWVEPVTMIVPYEPDSSDFENPGEPLLE